MPVTSHPPGIWTLFLTEMWERMSYYGMRALLVLFMVNQVQGMKMSDEQAAAVYGLYTALVYIMALPGGWIGDRLLGLRRAVGWGGLIIAVGHLILGVHGTLPFYVGLLVVAVGSGLLKSNMSVLVSQLYPEGGARRDAGYTLFYLGINLGALIGQIVCPWLAERYGWGWGFSAAALGMGLGLAQFFFMQSNIAHIGGAPEATASTRRDWRLVIGAVVAVGLVVVLVASGALQVNPIVLSQYTTWLILGIGGLFFAWALFFAGLDKVEVKRMLVVLILFFACAMFWAGFEQAGSSFTLFAERFTRREVLGFTIAAGQFQALNPIFILSFGALVTMLWGWLAAKNLEPSTTTKFAGGLGLLAIGMAIAAIAAKQALASGPVAPTWLMSVYLCHTLGELFISPIGLSAVSKLAPARLSAQVMGIWFLGASLGNLLSGQIAGEVTGESTAQMPAVLWQLTWVAGATALVLLLISKPMQKLMSGVR